MKRIVPMGRRESIRDGYLRKLREQGARYIPRKQHEGKRTFFTLTKRKPLKKTSKRQRDRLKLYFPIRNEWLKREENVFCAICLCRGLKPNPATEVHHRFGRNGPNLCDVRGFVASCFWCRDFPKDEPILARQLGVLGEAWEYDVPIDKHRTCNDAQKMR